MIATALIVLSAHVHHGAPVAQPDTAEAATVAASAACADAEYRQFDFWVGDWDVLGTNGKRVGTNRIEKQFGGCVLQEHWIGAGGSVGSSFNTFSPATKLWHQTWVDNQGTLLLLDGTFAAGTMTLTGQVSDSTGAKTTHRIRWSVIGGDPNRVRQLWESSTDGGKTWTVAFDGTYVRKATR
jgi:hypothetical protein